MVALCLSSACIVVDISLATTRHLPSCGRAPNVAPVECGCTSPAAHASTSRQQWKRSVHAARVISPLRGSCARCLGGSTAVCSCPAVSHTLARDSRLWRSYCRSPLCRMIMMNAFSKDGVERERRRCQWNGERRMACRLIFYMKASHVSSLPYVIRLCIFSRQIQVGSLGQLILIRKIDGSLLGSRSRLMNADIGESAGEG